MSTDFILGVGGTGAKCVEAFLYLASCGLGPEAAWVGMLDQDGSNGNSGRTGRLLSRYCAVRSALRAAGESSLGVSPAFATAIEEPKAGWAWAPEERSAASLSSSVGYPALPPAEQALMQALFTDQERRLQLDEGFRQRPALGAALTLQNVTADSPVWQDLLAALQAAGHGGEVRVFLMASIFGGTGASGFPTVARLLRAEIRRRGLERQVKLGGALLLPYFSFPAPPPAEDAHPAIRPDSAAFMMQARGALEYFAQLFRAELIFERLYVVGADPLVQLPSYVEGGASQANPPLLAEFIAGLAAVDFLRRRPDGNGEILVCGIGESAAVGWSDLPFETTVAGGLRENVGATIRAALAWHHLYGPALSNDAWRSCRREAWFRRAIVGDPAAVIGGPTGQRTIGLVSEYCAGLLRWFIALNRGGMEAGARLTLLDDARIAGRWDRAAVEHVPLADRLERASFAQFVAPTPGPSLAEVFSRMTYAPGAPDAAGVGGILAALRAACSDRPMARV